MSLNEIVFFPATVLVKHGAERKIAKCALPKPRKETKDKADKKFTIASVVGHNVTAGVLYFDTALIMPDPTTRQLRDYTNILISHEFDGKDGTGRIYRGLADPNDASDSRNKEQNKSLKYSFSLRAADLGPMGVALSYISRDFRADLEAINASYKFGSKNNEIRDVVRTTRKQTDAKTGDESVVECEPSIDLKALIEETYGDKTLPEGFRARRKTILEDGSKPTPGKHPKTGKDIITYAPFTFTDAEGNETPLSGANAYRVLKYNNCFKRIEIRVIQVSNSTAGGHSPQVILHRGVIVQVDSEEHEYDADCDVTSDAVAAYQAAAAAATTDAEPADETEAAVDDALAEYDDNAEAESEPQPEPEPVPEPPKPVAKKAPVAAAPAATPTPATTKVPAKAPAKAAPKAPVKAATPKIAEDKL